MIPHTIHQVWVGSAPVPPRYLEWARGWQELHPDWEYQFWTDDNTDWVPKEAEYLKPPVTPKWVMPMRADIVRYHVVARFGGVYVDMDFECLRPIDDLVDGVDAFVARQNHRIMSNGIFGATREHPFARALADGVYDNIRSVVAKGEARRPVGSGKPGAPEMSGPGFMARMAKQFGIAETRPELFYPYDWNELHRSDETFTHLPHCYAVHHWGSSRTKAWKES